MIKEEIWYDSTFLKLSRNEKLIFLFLSCHKNLKDNIIIKNIPLLLEEINEKLFIDPYEISESLSLLVKKGFLIKVKNHLSLEGKLFKEKTKKDLKSLDEINQVFDHWKEVFSKKRSFLDSKRRSIIQRSLQFYDVDHLCKAIDGCSKTPHNMGINDRNQKYIGLNVIFKDLDQIDRFIENSINPPSWPARSLSISDQMKEENGFIKDKYTGQWYKPR